MTEPMTDERLAELHQLDEEAPAGPWQWFGNTKSHEIYLATVDRGRLYMMGFERWGRRDARPNFWHPEGGPIQDFREVAMFEREYREDIRGIDNPVAHMMAKGRQGFHDLLVEVDRLRREVEALQDDAANERLIRSMKRSGDC